MRKMFQHAGLAFPACTLFGAVGCPPVTVSERPPITRSLALSAIPFYQERNTSKFNANGDLL